MALKDQVPFRVMKTHGLLLDDKGEKISKSTSNNNNNLTEEALFDPLDFLEGSLKQSGERKFGYGVDVMRAWIATKDTDKNIHIARDQLERVNKEVKLFRDVLRVLLMHSLGHVNTVGEFEKLSTVDKMMMVRLLEFSTKVTEMYEKFDLKGVYEVTQRFVVKDVSEFYLEFSKHRRRRVMVAN